jgi:hypothetical protein
MSTIVCESCGERYTLGVDAISMTSEELMNMMGAFIGTMPPSLLVAHPKTRPGNPDLLAEANETIRRLAPVRGWDCDACKHNGNRWRPIEA